MMAELPLALFTTLAPVGAGAFIALAVAFFTTKFSDEQLKKIDRMTTIPVVVLVAGFICAFFHLASPMHALEFGDVDEMKKKGEQADFAPLPEKKYTSPNLYASASEHAVPSGSEKGKVMNPLEVM